MPAPGASDEAQVSASLMAGFALIELDQPVAERAVILRCDRRMKLPDAIVWASAQVNARLLVTRDVKEFPTDDAGDSHSVPGPMAAGR